MKFLSTSLVLSGIVFSLPGNQTPEQFFQQCEPVFSDAGKNETFDVSGEIGFCNSSLLPLGNGSQIESGVCSETVMGDIPTTDNMPSVLIIEPKNGDCIAVNTSFTIRIKSINMEYGFFDDPDTLYYLSPQNLNADGIIQGHNHISIQKLDGENVPSAKDPLFFKGIEDPAVDNILTELSPEIEEPGEYRICTSTASQGHQPVLSPVASRGFPDDCIRIHIV
jgi:hypothetical protein